MFLAAVPTDLQPTAAERLRKDSIVQWMLTIHQSYPIVGILLLVMGLDILIGLCAAFITKTISSTVSQKGMTRKVVMLLLVGFGLVLEPYAGGLPLAKLIAMCFLVTEGISIVENSARAGVPVPQVLVDTLHKLRNDEKASVHSPVNIQRASSVEIKVPAPVSSESASIHSDSGVRINQQG